MELIRKRQTKIKTGNKRRHKKGIIQARHSTIDPDKEETPHWRQRTDTNLSTNEERRSTTTRRPFSTAEAHVKQRNHSSRNTFTNVTKSENSGKLVNGTGKRILETTCLKDKTKKGGKQRPRRTRRNQRCRKHSSSVARFTISNNHQLTTTREIQDGRTRHDCIHNPNRGPHLLGRQRNEGI
jgi:hypothetical protein